MLTFTDLVFINGYTIEHFTETKGLEGSFQVHEESNGTYGVKFWVRWRDATTIFYNQTKEDVNYLILKFQNSLCLPMFSAFLREVIFAMRRLESIDRPPCPITIGSLIGRWMTAHDDGWELYNSFLKWYWEFSGGSPDKWAKKGCPRLVVV